MKKTAAFIFFLSILAFAEEFNQFSLIASFPKPSTFFNVKSLAVISSNFVVQICDNEFAAFRTLKANGEFFKLCFLPKKRDFYYENAVLPAGTAVDNQLCLLLNNRLEFFTPDGEFIKFTSLSPNFSMENLQNIVGMAFNPQTKTFNFLLKNEKIHWLEYSFSGKKINSQEMPDFLTNSLFLVASSENVLLGSFNNQTVSLFYQNGKPVIPSETKSDKLTSPSEIQTAINNCVATLSQIFSAKIPSIIDISLSENYLWFQTSDYLFKFDTKGKIVNTPLLPKSYSDYSISDYASYTEKTPDNKFVWSNFNDRFFTVNGFGKNPQVKFWYEIIGNTNPVVDLCIDKFTNRWLLCQTDSGAEIIKKTPDGTIRNIQTFDNDSPPFSFVKTINGPLAVAGRYYCSPVEEIAGDAFPAPWQHNLNLNINEGSSEVISSAAITNEIIFFAVRTKFEDLTWQDSRSEIYSFDFSGNLIEEIDLSSGFLIPQDASSVLAFNELGEIYSFSVPPYTFPKKIAFIDFEYDKYICGFNCLSSNLYIIPMSNETIDYYSAPYYSSKKQKSAILIKPNNKNIAVIFDEKNCSLYIIGPDWKNKFLNSNPLGQLIKLGKKLEKNPEKTYKTLEKKSNKFKPYIKNLTIHLNKLNCKVDNLFICAGIKNIKLLDGSLNNISAEYGDEIIPLGSLNIMGKCSGEINCAQIKNLNIKNSFSGKLKTWFYDIFNINIDGKCENALIYSRKNIKKIQIGNSIVNSKIRSGISPTGLSGLHGDIKTLRVYGDIDSSEIIACANEGNNPGWEPDKNNDNEQFFGSIVTISGRILQRGSRTTFLSKGKNSLFVSKNPIKNLLIQLENSKMIINGELK